LNGRTVAFLLFMLLLPAGITGAGARELPQWELSADTMRHQQEPRLVIAEGDVVLSRSAELGEPLLIRADWMSYDPERGVVEARGRVRIETPAEKTVAAAASLHLESQTGSLEEALIHLVDSGLYLKGAKIEKTGGESYALEEAWLSACRPDDPACPPAWSLKSRRAKITLDGAAHLYHPSFQIREVPLVYSPYFLLPANTNRQSGFLLPELSRSRRDGFGVSLPYFINLSPSADVTLYPRYLDQRGLLAGAEFRYAAGPASRGMVLASFLADRHRDSDIDDFKDDNLLRDTTNRYWLRGKADHDFGDDLVLRLDLDLVSDQDFIQEFNTGSQGYNRNNQDFEEMFGRDLLEPSLTTRQSSLQLTRITPRTLVAGEFALQQDSRHSLRLLPGHNADGVLDPGETAFRNLDPSPLQALPRLHFSGRTPLENLPLSLAWSNEYTHYWRSRGIAAHRLDLHPRLITPIPRSGGWTEGRITTGVRQTMYQVNSHGEDYQWEHDRYQDRTAFDLEANLATTLVRDFALTGWPHFGAAAVDPPGESWLEHMFRPNLIYSYTARTAQDRLPDLDSVDRLEARNWLTYELNNYFELGGVKPVNAGEPAMGDLYSRFLAFFKVTQTYDIAEGRRDDLGPAESRREFSDLRFDLQASPRPRFDFRYQTNLSVYGAGVTRYELQGSYAAAGGARLALNYRYLKYSAMVEPYFFTTAGEQLHDVSASFTASLTEKITLHGLLKQSLTDNHIAEASLGLTYKPHCWALDLEVRRYVEEKSIMLIFSLDSIGQALGLTKRDI